MAFEHAWDDIRLAAEERFLRSRQVVGIATAGRPKGRLVFFLKQEAPRTVAAIADWAHQRGVDFEVKVTGAFQLR
jgi:hypothetical protein